MTQGDLLDDLASPDRDTREAAVRAVTPEALGPLLDALRDEGSPIEWTVAGRALGGLGDPAFDAVLAALHEPASDAVTRRLRWTFGSVRVSGLGTTYGRALSDTDESIRAAAAHEFQSRGDAALPHAHLLVPLLNDPDEHVRQRAVWAFAGIGRDVVPLLREVRRTKGSPRREALTALAETGGWDALEQADKELIRRLIRVRLTNEQPFPLHRPDTGWFALPTGDQGAVLDAFGLSDAEPVTQRLGLSAIGYIRHGRPHARCSWLYVTAELDGWTLVFGTSPELSYEHFQHLADGTRDQPVRDATRAMAGRLSERFGRACWYRSSTGDSLVAWCLAEGGEIVRHYDTEADEPELLGPPHPAEAGFRLPHVDTEYPPGWFTESDLCDSAAFAARSEQYQREQGLAPHCGPTDIAGRTSVDPATLGPDTKVRGHGVLALTECGREYGAPRGTQEI